MIRTSKVELSYPIKTVSALIEFIKWGNLFMVFTSDRIKKSQRDIRCGGDSKQQDSQPVLVVNIREESRVASRDRLHTR